MRETIRLIGTAIRRGSKYLELRNHAAALATMAPPKDYLGQVRNIYEDCIERWRYVKDPVSAELLTFEPHALWQLVLAGDGIGVGAGKGAGDCDCVSAALGAELEAIGMPVRIAVTAPPHSLPGRLFGHVFIQTNVPGHGWITVDPVMHPKHGFGAVPRHSRIAFFDLDGRLTGHRGNVVGLSGDMKGEDQMYQGTQTPPLKQWNDIGLGGADDGQQPEDWRDYGLPDFGAFSEKMGIVDLEDQGMLAEVDYELFQGPDGRMCLGARTPIIEVTPKDLRYVRKHGKPYHGMGGVGDTGAIYQYDGSLGFWGKIVSAAKSVGRKVSSAAGKIIKKIPGGKYLIKLGEKVWKLAKKYVRPLSRFVGKYATKLAPIAALVPGYGTALAAGLYSAGKVAQLMNRYDVKLTGKKGKPRKLKFKNSKKARDFQKHLKKASKKEEKKLKKIGKKAYGRGIKKSIAAKNLAKSASKKRKKMKMDGLGDYDGMGFVSPMRAARRRLARAKRMKSGLPVRRRPAGPLAPMGRRGPRRFGPLPPFGPRARRRRMLAKRFPAMYRR